MSLALTVHAVQMIPDAKMVKPEEIIGKQIWALVQNTPYVSDATDWRVGKDHIMTGFVKSVDMTDSKAILIENPRVLNHPRAVSIYLPFFTDYFDFINFVQRKYGPKD